MVVASLLVHAFAVVWCWTAPPFESPALIAPQLGKTSILLRVSAAARPKPAEMIFDKSLADEPLLPKVTQAEKPVQQPTPTEIENVVRPRQTAQLVLPEMQAEPSLRGPPEPPSLDPFTLPVAGSKAIAMAAPAAHLEASVARPRATDNPVPEMRAKKTMVPPVEVPVLDPSLTPLKTPKAAPIPAPVKTAKDAPQVLPRPANKETLPKLEAVTKIADLVAVASEASDASQGAVDELPRKLPINPAPLYPAEALAAGQQGNVVLRVKINAAGNVSAISIFTSSGIGSLDESALSTVRNWIFVPARRAGRPVAYEVTVPIEFFIRRRF